MTSVPVFRGRLPLVQHLSRNFPSLYRPLSISPGPFGEKDHKTIKSTTILVQDGVSIQELPGIVQIINGEFKVSSQEKFQAGKRFEGVGLEVPQVSKKLFKNINFEEEREMMLGFMRCMKITDVYKLLEVCPEEEVTPSVALTTIRRIFELENNSEFRNKGLNQYPEDSSATFTRRAVMERLIDVICNSSEPQHIIETLRTMGRDSYQGDRLKYLEKLCTECIVMITDKKMTVRQVCEAARAFHNLGTIGMNYIEKVWIGITDKPKEIHEKEICSIMSILPLVKKSRSHIYNVVERRMGQLWYKLDSDDVIKILHVLVQLKIVSSRMLPMISRWTNVNIHVLTEGNLRWIVYSFLSLNYTDENIENALTRYIKVKNLKVKDQSLVAVIMDYCVKMRIRSPGILDNAAEYFVRNSSKLTAPQINSFCRPYGLLNYEPPNASAFFHELEILLDKKFVQFPPDVMIDLLLSCVYLKRYPLNFVKKVFNPYFFDRIHSLEPADVRLSRTKLKVLDKALTIEAPNYSGPMLPKDLQCKRFFCDARILRCVNKIQASLIEIVGSGERITPSVFLPNFPSTELYVIDCVIDMAGKLSLHSFKWSNNKYALLIHVPEHYVLHEEILVGPQEMRQRHLTQCGFKVVNLSYDKLNKYYMYPELLKTYIEDMMKISTDL